MYQQVKDFPEKPQQLELLEDEPDTPFEVEYLLEIFFELNSARSGGGFGANPLSYQDIKAWAEMTLFPLNWWEVRALKRLDGTFLSYQAKKSKSKKPKPASKS